MGSSGAHFGGKGVVDQGVSCFVQICLSVAQFLEGSTYGGCGGALGDSTQPLSGWLPIHTPPRIGVGEGEGGRQGVGVLTR